ncbi:MAG: copper amine oxidase N-terminal domain-containing protein [Hyphomonadaceae bacterium]|nr:copper amine oxidase N-terminal domain-containing protein [Clostridia bacterium]
MKKIVAMISIISLLVVLTCSVAFAGDVKVFVNDVELQSDVPATIVSDRTFLPFRAVFNALGVKDENISWSQQSTSISINHNGLFLFIVVGSNGAVVGDKLVTLDATPFIKDGRTMVPIRFVAQALGANVDWDAATQSVKITTKN